MIEPNAYDVVLGKGRGTGNKAYSHLIKQNRIFYSRHEADKAKLIHGVIFAIRHSGGRFLHVINGTFYEQLDDKEVYNSVSGSLRQGGPMVRQQIYRSEDALKTRGLPLDEPRKYGEHSYREYSLFVLDGFRNEGKFAEEELSLDVKELIRQRKMIQNPESVSMERNLTLHTSDLGNALDRNVGVGACVIACVMEGGIDETQSKKHNGEESVGIGDDAGDGAEVSVDHESIGLDNAIKVKEEVSECVMERGWEGWEDAIRNVDDNSLSSSLFLAEFSGIFETETLQAGDAIARKGALPPEWEMDVSSSSSSSGDSEVTSKTLRWALNDDEESDASQRYEFDLKLVEGDESDNDGSTATPKSRQSAKLYIRSGISTIASTQSSASANWLDYRSKGSKTSSFCSDTVTRSSSCTSAGSAGSKRSHEELGSECGSLRRSVKRMTIDRALSSSFDCGLIVGFGKRPTRPVTKLGDELIAGFGGSDDEQDAHAEDPEAEASGGSSSWFVESLRRRRDNAANAIARVAPGPAPTQAPTPDASKQYVAFESLLHPGLYIRSFVDGSIERATGRPTARLALGREEGDGSNFGFRTAVHDGACDSRLLQSESDPNLFWSLGGGGTVRLGSRARASRYLVRPGLSGDAGSVSFESADLPGRYLARHCLRPDLVVAERDGEASFAIRSSFMPTDLGGRRSAGSVSNRRRASWSEEEKLTRR
mmetsp:Transcript_21480/g.49257  ORF Transcript_21480/g.49257 Transcript_21480/m.49257 type:complete len:710 (-) Transcript_21480:129-2258(-)